jgi:sugar lactone lactonase YvrE
MKIPATLLSIVLFASGSVGQSAEKISQPYPVVWTITDGIEAPESAYLDPKTRHLFLSQIGKGGGMAKDGDGWISKLTPEGKMLKNKWVTGLNAPKGIRSHGDLLWVSDIDRIVAISISQAKIVKSIAIENAKFLNDVATGPDGTVYVSDMIAGIVYAHKNGKTTVFAEGKQIEHPNGLLVHKGSLYLGGWGKNLQDDFSTKPLGRLLAINLKTGKQRAITRKPTGNLDGVEVDGKGGFIVTDWRAGKIFRITGKGKTTALIQLPRGTADHAFLTDRNWLILPEMLENKISAIDLGKAVK